MSNDLAIALLIAYGPEARAFGHSGLVRRLAAGRRVVVAAARPESEALAACGFGRIERAELVGMPDEAEGLLIRRLRGASGRLRRRGLTAAAAVERQVARRVGGSVAWRDFLRRHRIGAVVTASYASARTLPALQTAINLGLPTVALLNSWKDVFAKPYAPAPPAAVGVHGVNEARRFLSANAAYRGVIRPVGSLHWAAVAAHRGALDRRGFCDRMGLDPRRPIVCYCAAAGGAAEPEPGWVRRLIADSLWWPSRPQFLVRANPMAPSVPFPGAIVWRPRWEWDSVGDWCCPHPADTALWAAALDHVDVFLSAPSTVTLECAAAGKPVINLLGERCWRALWQAPFYAEARARGWAAPADSLAEIQAAVAHALAGGSEADWPRPVDSVAASEDLINAALGGLRRSEKAA